MNKTIFEQLGGTYTMQGDYRLPNITLPAEDERPIGVLEGIHRLRLRGCPRQALRSRLRHRTLRAASEKA